jgi:hypothetical protein
VKVYNDFPWLESDPNKSSEVKKSSPKLLCEACYKENCGGNCIWIIKFYRWIKKKVFLSSEGGE